MASAQNNKVVHLKSGDIVPVPNVASFDRSSAIFNDNIFLGRSYLVFQFNDVITEVNKASLVNLGVKVIEYIPDNSYIVSVPTNLDVQRIKQINSWIRMKK